MIRGTAWLESMKALAKAQRLARQREAQGLPPLEFVLPPTSMTPSGKRKPKQPGATVKKRKRDMHSEGYDNDIPALPDSMDLVSGPAEPRLDTHLEQPTGDDLPSLPGYAMYPSNDVGSGHDSASGFYTEGEERAYAHGTDNSYLESHLSAPGSVHADNVPQEYAALMTGAGGEEVHPEAHAPALQDPAYDPSAYGTDAASQQSIQHTGTYNHSYTGHYHDYTTNLGNFGALPLQTNTHYPLPAFQAFHDRAAQQQHHLSPVSPYGTPSHQTSFMLAGDQDHHRGDMPPVPTAVAKAKAVSQRRRIETLPGEKRKRGPAVKKLAADEGMPEWTDEQWEAERKKRKVNSILCDFRISN